MMLRIGNILLTAMLTMAMTIAPMGSSDALRPVVVSRLNALWNKDGTMVVYCSVQNVDFLPATDVELEIKVKNEKGKEMQTRLVEYFREDTLWPQQSELFIESFPDCWECESVEVLIF